MQAAQEGYPVQTHFIQPPASLPELRQEVERIRDEKKEKRFESLVLKYGSIDAARTFLAQEEQSAGVRAGEKPKRAHGSYTTFFHERRDKVKAFNPGISVKEIASKIGEEWRALSDAQKQVYEDKEQSIK